MCQAAASWQPARHCCVQVLRSLAFLHSLGLIHSDLKPENILIKSYSRCGLRLLLAAYALSMYAEFVGS